MCRSYARTNEIGRCPLPHHVIVTYVFRCLKIERKQHHTRRVWANKGCMRVGEQVRINRSLLSPSNADANANAWLSGPRGRSTAAGCSSHPPHPVCAFWRSSAPFRTLPFFFLLLVADVPPPFSSRCLRSYPTTICAASTILRDATFPQQGAHTLHLASKTLYARRPDDEVVLGSGSAVTISAAVLYYFAFSTAVRRDDLKPMPSYAMGGNMRLYLPATHNTRCPVRADDNSSTRRSVRR
ncbi:hypothetical protein B0H16DRAFT_983448 [Mycena metata]|uniref:Uncharacterized protein n=1 Tax=Mycena metata TaxID=1033252 RepID=A0AAD7DG65_9AGAR|nr:hypothetical protein B0H16DRAFT_983448 [Mycena metata]